MCFLLTHNLHLRFYQTNNRHIAFLQRSSTNVQHYVQILLILLLILYMKVKNVIAELNYFFKQTKYALSVTSLINFWIFFLVIQKGRFIHLCFLKYLPKLESTSIYAAHKLDKQIVVVLMYDKILTFTKSMHLLKWWLFQ